MATTIQNESKNTEREKANLLNLIKLTLNTLIDQSSSPSAIPILDDRNTDITNFILVLERILSFRMRASWLTDRTYFWDFIRPACIGSCRKPIIERVEEISNSRNSKDKGRAWLKLALMEKKLSELLKLVISDCYLVRKFYHDDSIMTSSQVFIICDQLAALNAIDFSFCFKQDNLILAPLLLNDSEIDVIDLTPFLCYKSKQIKQALKDQNSNEENKQPSPNLASMNEHNLLNSSQGEVLSIEKYKLEVEQRKYFEELLRHRDRELQQLKIRYDTLKSEREREIVQMENIILELQLELRTARDDIEFRRRKSLQPGSNSPPKNSSHLNNQKINSPPTPTNDQTKIRTPESVENTDSKQSNDLIYSSSSRSSHSTTTTNTDDDQYDLARQLPSNANHKVTEIKSISSPEMISSATSLSISSTDEEEQRMQTVTTTTPEDSSQTQSNEIPVE
ncbi:unnamed protein product [Adineta steineri]|uniref:RUN domain-containing protein n=1 Tax=Adineta steineri TaxID=433720 RepID=A0A813SE89_9BILA|nr:unnamed protein product [Adineta steineri]